MGFGTVEGLVRDGFAKGDAEGLVPVFKSFIHKIEHFKVGFDAQEFPYTVKGIEEI
jgi:hypothetical protein